MTEPTHPKCALCGVSACEDEPIARRSPPFCPSLLEPELLAEADKVYQESETIRTLAQAAARTEAAGYMRRTRIEDTMDFARRLGADRLGIAHCVGFMQEARLACKIFEANGFEVYLSKSYYNRLLKAETADDYLRRLMP